MPLPENPWQRRILFISTVLSVVLFAWLLGDLGRPRVRLPEKMVASAWLRTSEGTLPWEKAPVSEAFYVQKAATELDRLAAFMDRHAPFASPVRLTVDLVDRDRYEVSAAAVRLGRDVAFLPGRLARAILKAWLWQSGRAEIISSFLRREAAADVLLALYEGELGAADSGGEPRRITGWLSQVASWRTVCEKPDKPEEMTRLCDQARAAGAQGEEAAPIAFRALLASVVWRAYETVGVRQRLDFARGFFSALQASSADAAAPQAPPRELAGLRDWLRVEALALVGDPAHYDETLARWPALFDESLLLHGLDEKVGVRVASVFHTDRSAQEVLERSLAPALVQEEDGRFRLFPGGAAFSLDELKGVKFRHLIWESCETPDVRALKDYPVVTKSALYIRNCDRSEIDYFVYEKWGVEEFAKIHPGLAFVQIHRSSLGLWMQKGADFPQGFLKGLLDGVKGADRDSKATGAARGRDARHFDRSTGPSASLLGFEAKEWRRDIGAYRVWGAVEAFPWYRPDRASTN